MDDLDYHSDTIMSRNNSDKLLLNLWKETRIRILNGRTTGDLNGQPTCITYNGSSHVDYTLTSEELLKLVGYFEVHDFTSLTNHRPISCGIFADTFFKYCNSHKLDPLPGKIIWTDDVITLYTENIQSQIFKNRIIW